MAKDRTLALRKMATCSSVAVAVVAALLSCAESTSPPQSVQSSTRVSLPKKVSNDLSSLPPSLVSLPAAGGSIVSLVDYSSFSEGVLVDIAIAGTISFSSHSMAFPINYSGPLDYLGVRVENQSGCYLNAKVEFSQISGAGNPFPNTTACLIPRTMSDYTVRAKVGGVGRALRGPMPLGNTWPCDSIRSAGDQCYITTGSQLVTVAPVAADLRFRAEYSTQNAQTIYVPPFTSSSYYREVTFRESSLPEGLGIPYKPLNRAWQRADTAFVPGFLGTTDINMCPNGSPPLFCYIYVKESGVMRTQTRVNGVVHSDSACVQCAVYSGNGGDSVINADEVRTRMIDLAVAGQGTNSNPSLRTEQVLLIARDNTDGRMVTLSINENWTNQCQSGWNPENPAGPGLQGYTIMAYVHTHPQYRDEVYNCPNGRKTTGEPGGSREDWQTVKTLNQPPSRPSGAPKILMYVMANDYIYRLDPDLGPGTDKVPLMRWDKGRCKWVRFTNHS